MIEQLSISMVNNVKKIENWKSIQGNGKMISK